MDFQNFGRLDNKVRFARRHCVVKWFGGGAMVNVCRHCFGGVAMVNVCRHCFDGVAMVNVCRHCFFFQSRSMQSSGSPFHLLYFVSLAKSQMTKI